MLSRIVNGFLVCILILGAAIGLYPMISDYWNSRFASRVIVEYAEDIEKIERNGYLKMWEDAQRFNERLAKKEFISCLTAEEWEEYEKLLTINESGVMGYLEVEKLGLWLPIYHGTEESVLQTALGHMEWTSLPTGGENTHTVIAGHSGLPQAKLFSNLDKMEIGDQFVLHILDKTLRYQVDQIEIVDPEDIELLKIVENEDYCTLVTCTPYGINSQRLLVRGKTLQKNG